MNELHHDPQAIAARLTALVAAVERLILAEDGSQEKCDAIDALYLNFNYRHIRADIAQLQQAEQARDMAHAALRELRINANRLCDRNMGGSYEEDCRRSIANADAVLEASR